MEPVCQNARIASFDSVGGSLYFRDADGVPVQTFKLSNLDVASSNGHVFLSDGVMQNTISPAVLDSLGIGIAAFISALESAAYSTDVVAKLASFTLSLDEVNALVECSSVSTITVTIPAHVDVAIPIGAAIVFAQAGVGEVTFAPAVGVTLYSAGNRFTTADQHAMATLIKVADNVWRLEGNLVP